MSLKPLKRMSEALGKTSDVYMSMYKAKWGEFRMITE